MLNFLALLTTLFTLELRLRHFLAADVLMVEEAIYGREGLPTAILAAYQFAQLAQPQDQTRVVCLRGL